MLVLQFGAEGSVVQTWRSTPVYQMESTPHAWYRFTFGVR